MDTGLHIAFRTTVSLDVPLGMGLLGRMVALFASFIRFFIVEGAHESRHGFPVLLANSATSGKLSDLFASLSFSKHKTEIILVTVSLGEQKAAVSIKSSVWCWESSKLPMR